MDVRAFGHAWISFVRAACDQRRGLVRQREESDLYDKQHPERGVAAFLFRKNNVSSATPIMHVLPLLTGAVGIQLRDEFCCYRYEVHAHPLVFSRYFQMYHGETPETPNSYWGDLAFRNVTFRNLLDNRLWNTIQNKNDVSFPRGLAQLALELEALSSPAVTVCFDVGSHASRDPTIPFDAPRFADRRQQLTDTEQAAVGAITQTMNAFAAVQQAREALRQTQEDVLKHKLQPARDTLLSRVDRLVRVGPSQKLIDRVCDERLVSANHGEVVTAFNEKTADLFLSIKDVQTSAHWVELRRKSSQAEQKATEKMESHASPVVFPVLSTLVELTTREMQKVLVLLGPTPNWTAAPDLIEGIREEIYLLAQSFAWSIHEAVFNSARADRIDQAIATMHCTMLDTLHVPFAAAIGAGSSERRAVKAMQTEAATLTSAAAGLSPFVHFVASEVRQWINLQHVDPEQVVVTDSTPDEPGLTVRQLLTDFVANGIEPEIVHLRRKTVPPAVVTPLPLNLFSDWAVHRPLWESLSASIQLPPQSNGRDMDIRAMWETAKTTTGAVTFEMTFRTMCALLNCF